ncbi:HD domain-containing protein [Lacrimispora amygdalina]|uniref:HD domain-containing protein n=1 Tax=Lacrimispora amygdalina TaxID=253257 RepID=A0A3E2N3T5_9FIRM|nr:HD domain-containing phosphohydrolase [Clostridium indicum]RFZ75638.1 HD domain-containing protein [Clostridium indicum]
MGTANRNKLLMQGTNTKTGIWETIDYEPKNLSTELHIKTLAMQEICIHAMSSLAGISYDEEGGHIVRTQHYVRVLADHLAQTGHYTEVLTPENILLISKSAMIHDIGKVGIPEYILMKPALLTQQEFEIMKTHTTLGYQAIVRTEKTFGEPGGSYLRFAKEIVYSHHERWDGSGYPLGLAGERIPLSARLMALADVYDALTSKRVYKDSFSHERACFEIQQNAGKHFDPHVAEAFLATQRQFKEISKRYVNENDTHLYV